MPRRRRPIWYETWLWLYQSSIMVCLKSLDTALFPLSGTIWPSCVKLFTMALQIAFPSQAAMYIVLIPDYILVDIFADHRSILMKVHSLVRFLYWSKTTANHMLLPVSKRRILYRKSWNFRVKKFRVINISRNRWSSHFITPCMTNSECMEVHHIFVFLFIKVINQKL